MTLRNRVILVDDDDWREFQRINPDNPGAYATAALGIEGDRLRIERARCGDTDMTALNTAPRGTSS